MTPFTIEEQQQVWASIRKENAEKQTHTPRTPREQINEMHTKYNKLEQEKRDELQGNDDSMYGGLGGKTFDTIDNDI